jgi:putrescine transport system permease protein
MSALADPRAADRQSPGRLARWLRAAVPSGRTVVIAAPFVFLLVFFMLPFAAVLKISFSDVQMSVPPYTPIADLKDGVLRIVLNFAHYGEVLSNPLYISAYAYSLEVAGLTTLICLLIGYPACYLIARADPARRNLLIMAVMLPFWTSYLIRVYAWIGLLKNQGLINSFLLWAHLIDEPLKLYHNNYGLLIGMVYNYLPYLMLPLYAQLVKLDMRLLEAAGNLGARPWQAFVTITLPLSLRAIVSSSLLVFIPAVGEYVIPEILGGSNSLMVGRVMYDDFFVNADWPTASAATGLMVLLLLVPMAVFQRLQRRELEAR